MGPKKGGGGSRGGLLLECRFGVKVTLSVSLRRDSESLLNEWHRTGPHPNCEPYSVARRRSRGFFPATFLSNCCQNAVKSRWRTDPKQLEASQLPVTPPENLVELRGIEPLTLRLPVSRKGKK